MDTARSRYEYLSRAREAYRSRAEEAASYTIPGLMPPQGTTGDSKLPQPYQSAGANGVNNLKGQLMTALFPPGTKFFRFGLTKEALRQLEQAASVAGMKPEEMRGNVEFACSQMEQEIMDHVEQNSYRPVLDEALGHLIVCGNGLLLIQPDGGLKFFPLSRYVVKRDTEGNVLEIVVVETLSRKTLPEDIQNFVKRNEKDKEERSDDADDIDLYTWVKRQENGSYTVHQEILDMEIPGTDGVYPKGKSPWLPLRWKRISGEDYGRSMCDEYLGDLKTAEMASRSILEITAACAKIILMVRPSSLLTPSEIAEAAPGDVFEGEAGDVSAVQIEKYNDFRTCYELLQAAERRLAQAFMQVQSIQRAGERVTAEEIRTLAGALENTLGGVYSLLSDELQRPLVVRLMHQLKALPQLPAGSITPKIVTGLEGLGRSSDLQKLKMFVVDIAQTFGPQAVSTYINPTEYMKKVLTSLGLATDGILRSPEEVAQMNQQAQMAEMTGKLGGPMIKAVSDNVKQQGAQ